MDIAQAKDVAETNATKEVVDRSEGGMEDLIRPLLRCILGQVFDRCQGACEVTGTLGRFECKSRPPIEAWKYAICLISNGISVSAILHGLYYFDRICPLSKLVEVSMAHRPHCQGVKCTIPKKGASATICLTDLHAHRLLLSLFMIASKFFDDHFVNNAVWCKTGGLQDLHDLNKMEAEALAMLDCQLFISPENMRSFVYYLLTLTCHDSLLSDTVHAFVMAEDTERFQLLEMLQQRIQEISNTTNTQAGTKSVGETPAGTKSVGEMKDDGEGKRCDEWTVSDREKVKVILVRMITNRRDATEATWKATLVKSRSHCRDFLSLVKDWELTCHCWHPQLVFDALAYLWQLEFQCLQRSIKPHIQIPILPLDPPLDTFDIKSKPIVKPELPLPTSRTCQDLKGLAKSVVPKAMVKTLACTPMEIDAPTDIYTKKIK